MTVKKRISVQDVMKRDFRTIDGNATVMEALDELFPGLPPFLSVGRGNRSAEPVNLHTR